MTEPQNSDTAVTTAQPDHSVDEILRRLATRAMGLTGADIERVVREARLKARRGTSLLPALTCCRWRRKKSSTTSICSVMAWR